MGHKVHPTGIRLGIAKDWNSKWYANKGEYAQYLAADLKVREMLRKKLAAAGISKIQIERPAKTARVTIFTARPGVVIGKKGEDIEKLRKEVTDMMGVPTHINVSEVRKPELDAQLVAESIAQQLERRIMFRRAMKRSVGNAMRLGALGIKINVSGRLERRRNRALRVGPRRSRSAAYPARGHRLRHRRGQDPVRHHWCQGLGLQGRDLRSGGRHGRVEGRTAASAVVAPRGW